MTRVLSEMRRWASTLPYWEQAALDMIIAGKTFSEADYGQLLQYLLEDAGLSEVVSARPTLCFPNSEDSTEGCAIGPVRIERIFNFQNVNALVDGQSLSFGPALTVLYGGNGSGKSGYARVLGCAGFSRGDQVVLPDVTRPANANEILSADIELHDGSSTRTIHYQVRTRCPDLHSLYCFDSTSVVAHLTRENTLSFSPAGLSYLGRLAEVTDHVRARLQAKIDSLSEPQDFASLFQGESDIKKLIVALGPRTDLGTLRAAASVTADERQRLEKLELEIADLKREDIPTKIQGIQNLVTDLKALTVQLQEVGVALDEDAMADLLDSVNQYLELQNAAQRLSVAAFKSEFFTETGSDVWLRFVEAAKELADAEIRQHGQYPSDDDHCLLCNQPLSQEARELLRRLWAFLEGDAQTRMERASTALEEKRRRLEEVNLKFFDEQSVYYRHIQQRDGQLLAKISAFVSAASGRRECAIEAIKELKPVSYNALTECGASEIESIISTLQQQIRELQEKDPTQQIAEYEAERLRLQQRLLLGNHLAKIEDYVQRRKWAEQAGKIRGSTRHITAKHNELLKQLVSDRYVQVFEQALRDLKRPLKVKVRTRGEKAQALKQIVLETDPSMPTEKARLDKVLSEGEKRAVALADFLTEVALDDTSSAVVLDDPVTSLDHEWKETLALRLVNEAKHRQVIIFTHDLVFLYQIRRIAEQEEIEVRTHWVKRGDNDGRPGYVYEDNSPAVERDYRSPKQARKLLDRASQASPEEQETLLKAGFAALRTTYEAFIISDLLGDVVQRFEERISFGRLKDIMWDKSIANAVIEKCELLSRYIEGHLHSDAYLAEKPTPKTLLAEIEAFQDIKRRHKALGKPA